MIVGNGDIATVLPDREDLLFFASGVSNSQETRESEYAREMTLLLAQDRSQHAVYFSSLAVFSSDTQYVQHKRHMEGLVREHFDTHTIVRIGNISWNYTNNPNTLINFLRNRIESGEPFEIHDTYRYVVDKKEFLYWVGLIPEWSCEMNIPGRRMTVREIVKEIIEGKL